jgi:NADP-dependent 3-hydroxy acid dehydrogenase YdfG
MSSTTAAESLAGRSAVVTGASRGIGLEIADALNRAGVRVVMLSRDLRDSMNAALDRQWPSRGKTPFDAFAVEQGSLDSTEVVAAQIRAHLGAAPDILINNAAEFYVASAHETSTEDFAHTMTVNLTSHFALVRAWLPAMRERRAGHIVTIGSIADHKPLPGNVAYGASKYALRGMHEVLREELRGTGVRTTLVSPARVDTSIWNDSGAPIEPPDGMLAATDVAASVMFALTQPATVNVDEIRVSRA